jgi:hypothetical protein
MDPITNHQLGQMTHREYEARYGQTQLPDETSGEGKMNIWPRTLAISLSGAAVIAFFFIQFLTG